MDGIVKYTARFLTEHGDVYATSDKREALESLFVELARGGEFAPGYSKEQWLEKVNASIEVSQ